MYQIEHNEFFQSIRSGKRHADEDWLAHSTLMALLGRKACYTGQQIKFADYASSDERLVPENIDWNGDLPVRPTPIPGVAETQDA